MNCRFLCIALVALLAIVPAVAFSDDREGWEEYLISLYENSEEAAVSVEEAYEHLTELARQPLDVNTAETEELLMIPGLDLGQVNDIIEYREKYGRMRSISELAMIQSIDNRQREFLSSFLCVEDTVPASWHADLIHRLKRGDIRHTVTATASIPTYYRAGDRYGSSASGGNRYAGAYLGYPIKHSLRYNAKVGSHLALNITGANDAAEPFAAHGNGYGYDAYAFNVILNNAGMVRRLILGKFRGQFGMGLTFNNSFSLGKQASLAATNRVANVFTPHSSASDARHMQGACVTMDVGKLQLSAFASWRYIDATLNNDGTISTILTSGYHRTVAEMAKKNNASQTACGAHLRYSGTLPYSVRYSVGASFVLTHLSSRLDPTFTTSDTISASRLYRLYSPHGSTFCNGAVDYTLHRRNLTFAGECAINDCGAIATLNTLQWRATNRFTASMAQRYYSYRYYALYGKALSDGGNVQNESGLLFTIRWEVLPRVTVDAYSDVAYYPWLRYRTSQSSYSWDNSVTAAYTRGFWTLSLRYRAHSRQQDAIVAATGSRMLAWRTNHRLRLILQRKSPLCDLRTQAEACLQSSEESSKGAIISQSASFSVHRLLSVYAMAAYFNTEDYNSRLYAYERGATNTFGYTSYYGNGCHAALMLTSPLLSWLTLTLKASHTRYFDRNTIGTAERQIFSNRQTDIDLQMKIKL